MLSTLNTPSHNGPQLQFTLVVTFLIDTFDRSSRKVQTESRYSHESHTVQLSSPTLHYAHAFVWRYRFSLYIIRVIRNTNINKIEFALVSSYMIYVSSYNGHSSGVNFVYWLPLHACNGVQLQTVFASIPSNGLTAERRVAVVVFELLSSSVSIQLTLPKFIMIVSLIYRCS